MLHRPAKRSFLRRCGSRYAWRKAELPLKPHAHRIEDSCVNIIALQQPLARDLRTITAALKIVTDMERISDQCCDTCEILRALAPLSEGARPPVHLGEMLERARSMFDDALSAFVSHDIALSYEVCDRDDEVDALFSRTILEICAAIEGQPVVVPRGADYMFIAKYIERIADHATNIAEWTIFIETGEHPVVFASSPAPLQAAKESTKAPAISREKSFVSFVFI